MSDSATDILLLCYLRRSIHMAYLQGPLRWVIDPSPNPSSTGCPALIGDSTTILREYTKSCPYWPLFEISQNNLAPAAMTYLHAWVGVQEVSECSVLLRGIAFQLYHLWSLELSDDSQNPSESSTLFSNSTQCRPLYHPNHRQLSS